MNGNPKMPFYIVVFAEHPGPIYNDPDSTQETNFCGSYYEGDEDNLIQFWDTMEDALKAQDRADLYLNATYTPPRFFPIIYSTTNNRPI